MEVKEGCFLLGRSRFTAMQMYQIGKSWFCAQVCGKKIRQNYVVLLINDRSKPLLCHKTVIASGNTTFYKKERITKMKMPKNERINEWKTSLMCRKI